MIDRDAVRIDDSVQWRTRPPHRTTSWGHVIDTREDAVRVKSDYGRYWIPWERVLWHEPGRALADSKVLP